MTQGMYRKYPKKQDHGSRGNSKRKAWSYRLFKREVISFHAEQRKRKKRLQKVELNKLFIDCSEEEIEKYFLNGYPSPKGDWYFFD